MALLNSQRNTLKLDGRTRLVRGVETETTIYLGAMVAVDANGYLVPAQPLGSSPLNSLAVLGTAYEVQNGAYPGIDALNGSGAAGAILLEVDRKIARMDNDGSITFQAGQLCYAVDDHTVALTDGGGAIAVTEAAYTSPAVTVSQITRLAHRPIVPGTVLLQNSAKSTTYVEGTDYAVDYADGLLFLISAVLIAGAVSLELGYSYVAAQARPVAGRIVDIDSIGVWVDFLDQAVLGS